MIFVTNVVINQIPFLMKEPIHASVNLVMLKSENSVFRVVNRLLEIPLDLVVLEHIMKQIVKHVWLVLLAVLAAKMVIDVQPAGHNLFSIQAQTDATNTVETEKDLC